MDKSESSFTLHSDLDTDSGTDADRSPWQPLHSAEPSPGLDSTRDRLQVQRSVSLKLPDTRPRGLGIGGGKDRDVRDINGNFELAHLLARASSLDAKLTRELQGEEGGYSSERHLRPLPDWPSFEEAPVEKSQNEKDLNSLEAVRRTSFSGEGKEEGCGVTDRVTLPLRYRQLLLRRRASRPLQPAAPSPGGGSGSLHTLGCLPEAPDDVALETAGVPLPGGESSGLVESPLAAGESPVLRQRSLGSISGSSVADRQRDAKLALQWAHQEIRGLKQQNRTLLRQLLELGAAIHRQGGMDSCQSVSGTLFQTGDSLDDDPPGGADPLAPLDQDSSIASSSMVAINTHSTPRKVGRLSFTSLDHFFRRD